MQIFREGGPLRICRKGFDKFTATIDLPTDTSGLLGRECPDPACAPGYFKVTNGTGITEPQSVTYCPYCRKEADPNDFATTEQVRYARDTLTRHAVSEMNRVLPRELGMGAGRSKTIGAGLFSINLSYQPTRLPVVSRPREEELRRDLVCPGCSLHHAVFGLAIWCPDCGRDIFIDHVVAELAVMTKILDDLPRRREMLGTRAWAKDLENALEDVVSIFEATLRALTYRHLVSTGMPSEAAWHHVQQQIGNGYQSISRGRSLFEGATGVSLFEGMPDDELRALETTFEKRHPITHNLGVVDRKFLDRTRAAASVGRELRITEAEVRRSIELSLRVVRNAHSRLFLAK